MIWEAIYHCHGIVKIDIKTGKTVSINMYGFPRMYPHQYKGSGMQNHIHLLNSKSAEFIYMPFWQEWKNLS